MNLMPSNRIFGFFASGVLICAALYALLVMQESKFFLFFFFFGVLSLVLTVVAPKALYPLNRLWFLLGDILGRAISPVVLLVIFFFLLTPIGVLTRLFGRDELRLHMQQGKSCWVLREQPKVSSESFKNQY